MPYSLKLNCWEFIKCGREPGGGRERECGVCPASVEEKLDGIHDGLKAGRACWVVSGTLRVGCAQGTRAKQVPSCELCDFYQYVKGQEDSHFKLSSTLISILMEEEDPVEGDEVEDEEQD